MKPDKVWQAALGELQLQMTKATFDTWVKATRVVALEGDLFTIGVQNGYAKDWLENRLRGTVQRTLAGILNRPVEVRFQVVNPPAVAPVDGDGGEAAPSAARVTVVKLAQAELLVDGVRVETYNQVVEPDRVFVGTQYFRERWLPLLGPVTWLAILELRQRCYWNKRTGEKREWCNATYAEIAGSVGVSPSTVIRALNPEDAKMRAYVDLFILEREVLRGFSQRLGREVNLSTRWRLRLDEPLAPGDEALCSNCQNDK